MTPLEVLVVDDEPAIRQVLAAHIGMAGHSVSQAGDGPSAMERLSRGDVDVAICDIQIPGISGIELLRQSRAAGIDTNFIMITAYASLDTAIEAIKAGATDYMIKPLRNEEVMHRLMKVADLRGLRAENRVLRSIVRGTDQEVFRYTSPAWKTVEQLIEKAAPTDSTMLITGESGTGKGVIARLIHERSSRAEGPFIPVNCGAIPENLMESELFGHAKGSFTGAARSRKGLFLEADSGTIFLDEIGELPLQLQVKLLHVIEEKAVRPVGAGGQARMTDARVIAATNRDLRQMLREGTFREDLYFRLNVIYLVAPPLRQMRQDIPGLIRFLLRHGVEHQGDGEFTIDPHAEKLLAAYDWPGNVREMKNVIDRALILAEKGHISSADLPAHIMGLDTAGGAGATLPDSGGSLRDQVRRYEISLIRTAIKECGGDRRLAAQKLGIALSGLYKKLQQFDDREVPGKAASSGGG